MKLIRPKLHNRKISFLDVLLMRCNEKLETTIFIKKLITTYIYIGDLLLPQHIKKIQ